ncbi:ATP-dependent 6-phosphofructokinase [Halodesulfovibrio sp.]|jgi:6-phosphofructokinase 1|uniref:ATP-dependent 6-phosphofructokinase n=1 Tax=Halodesulfovibrio sp. TaxID=1912772 RepID=UPI0025D0EC56|nr:ATP-dependent 6-phosphofructokinase [Halodesulfovibrio sp.]MCT4534424.1 ATP-dependent 6-phosphofructokinase [Halodesulfovibrio sp.]MCT4627254.1 ATP-dependent 6-phosphofructokinase [Halodesulfovibrio sp.]
MPEKRARYKNLNISTVIPTLGCPKIPSPLAACKFETDERGVDFYLDNELHEEITDDPIPLCFEKAGPRQHVFFDTPKTKCAIVTCGGLCPGINEVIRSIVMAAFHNYHVSSVLGIKYGLEGFIPEYGHEVVELTPQMISHIHLLGGTILGSSRGPQSTEQIVDALERLNINCLFMIGGDGTMKAANDIVDEVTNRKLKISVIGVPKTIDNDIDFIPQTFGFETAVDKATEAIQCAHTEAQGSKNGIGLVKLMGRESGFIAAHASLSLKEVNFVLIPEKEFALHGEGGLLDNLEQRLKTRKHAVIVVAEGAGQHLISDTNMTDASGNKVLGDIMGFLKKEIHTYMSERNIPYTIKLIDPSYIIRSVPANANDRVYCGFLGQNAVHAAMAGKTAMVVSKLMDRFVHLPLRLVTRKRRKLNTQSDYWRAVMESTGQSTLIDFQHKALIPEPGDFDDV